MTKLQEELESARNEMKKITEEKETVEVKSRQQGVNEEEAKRKSQELLRQLSEDRRAAENRLKELQREEAEALQKAKEVKQNMTHGDVDIADEHTKVDVYQHTHYDTKEGISASTARVVSGDKKVEVDHPNPNAKEEQPQGLIGSMLNKIF